MTGSDPVNHDEGVPSRNRRKVYVEDGYYHAYNRGVEKRDIFLDDQDYRVFLSFMKAYLSAPETPFLHPVAQVTGSDPVRLRPLGSFFGKVSLLAYCLMPNHFHLLIQQTPTNGMTEFIRALCTSYSMYFNKKYVRVGTLFQGVYKATHVDSDRYLLHLTRYIHLNPFELTGSDPVNEYPYSSYVYYLGRKHTGWLHPEQVLSYFRSAQQISFRDTSSYQSFVEDYKEDPRSAIEGLAID